MKLDNPRLFLEHRGLSLGYGGSVSGTLLALFFLLAVGPINAHINKVDA